MEDRLGVAGGLLGASEHQLAGGGEGQAVEAWGHGDVQGVAGVLLVDHDRHGPQCIEDLFLGDDAVQQPVGQMLRGDATGGPVLHQGDVVDVGHLRTSHALVDPAHHVAEDPLRVVLDLAAASLCVDGARVDEGNGQQRVERRRRPHRRAPPVEP